MYFRSLPKFEYNFPKGSTGSISSEMADIFRRVTFTKKTKDDLRNFIEYVIGDGETPDDVAFKIYGDAKWFWLVLLSNNIIDVENEWPQSQNKIQRKFSDTGFYKGHSIFVEEFRDFQKGDVVAKAETCTMDPSSIECLEGVTASIVNYAIVDFYDKELSKINVKLESSSFSLSDNDDIVTVRKIQGANGDTFRFIHSSTGCGYGDANFKVKKITTIADGVEKFKYGSWDISPISTATGGGPIPGGPSDATEVPYISAIDIRGLCCPDDCVNDPDANDTMIYKYINGESLPTGFKTLSFQEAVYEEQFKKRKIKLVHPKLIGKIYDEFKKLMQNDVSRGTTTIIEVN
jgi:hypothetical protein